MSLIVVNGDNLELLKKYPDNYFDAVVTDPPYGLGKEPEAAELMKDWIEHGYHEISGSGFMGKEWDAFVPQPLFWKEVFRVLKHGGHVVAFYGTRTYDWGVMAMRFAGFEVRDCIQWLYGSGFPKSHNISKAIDKMYGAEREVIGQKKHSRKGVAIAEERTEIGAGSFGSERISNITLSVTEEAKKWDGWGSALKPANEPIVLARKPLEKGLSIAENVLKWGTGGINIDGCRIGFTDDVNMAATQKTNNLSKVKFFDNYRNDLQIPIETYKSNGRFPANIILTHHPECECKGVKKVKAIKGGSAEATMKSGNGKNGIYGKYSHNKIGENAGGLGDENGQETVEDWNCHPDCPIKILDEQSGILKSGDMNGEYNWFGYHEIYGKAGKREAISYGDKGGASRFFYVAKASKSERNNGLRNLEVKQTKGGGGTYNEEAGAKYGSIKAAGQNFHPTVKPVKLMQYLIRLVTPPNGIVLDPFCGSGTTGIACKLEGFQFVGMEQDPEYAKIAEARIKNYKEEKEEPLQEIKQEDGKDKVKKYIQANLFN